ncbi:Carbohydrate kinase PfkB [Macleaya cordata]|uniref:Carbohydrate kinase PfkB n=1 Tax=Macleaya cordata TaxID=56857 RepID=A0A200R7I1_MACCD|nr:Carbohydrate kinase PfkB [Macleaya cordata]
MENNVWRRLNTLSRHLLIKIEANQVLHSNCLSALDGVSEPVIIGAMILDIHGIPYTQSLPRTTNPGMVHYVAGGVARNVAECMTKLGSKPFMVSMIGVDMPGNLLLDYWKSAGLAVEGIQRRQDVGTPVVCNVFDVNGELAAAVASVEAIEKFLTEEWIQQFRCNIFSAPVLMIDANLSPSSLEASCRIASESGIPTWFEPVSVAKSRRVVSVVKYVTFASPNEDELIAMANALTCGDRFPPIQAVDNSGSRRPIECLLQLLKPAINVLLVKGIKLVVVTLGSDGVLLCSKGGLDLMEDHLKNIKPSSYGKQLYEIVTLSCPSNKFVSQFERGSSDLIVVHFPSLPASVVRLTGAGDCFVGGTLASLCAGLDVMQSIAVGMAAAKATVEVETNVPSEYFLDTIADDARQIYSSAKVLGD